ncbi:MAG: DUF3971 domain-containing protein [Bacteroidetes bacterium]|nr:DUF3971 domain-containing protein [Bacteroidota bacterium]
MIKRFLKITGIVMLSFILLCVVIGIFYGEEVKKLMIGELNKSLTTEVNVKEFDFSILRHFPFASVDMKQVVIKEATDKKIKDTLLYADHLSLLFNITGLFSKDFTVKKIVLKDAKVKVVMDENGKGNYHFWKSSSGSASSSGIDLKKIVLANVSIRYIDHYNKQDYLAEAKEAELSGKFSSDEFLLKTKADLMISHLLVDKIDYVHGKEATIRAELKVNNRTNEYVFVNSSVRIASLAFDMNGKVTSLDHSTKLNLSVNSSEADLGSFISLLPETYVNYFKNFRSKGKFYFACHLTGQNDSSHTPDVGVTFSVTNGSITPKESEVSFEDIRVSGSFINHNRENKSVLEIPSFSATLGGRNLKADLVLEDFQNPFLTLHAATNLDLSRLRHFIQMDTLETLSGDLAMNISFAGKIKDLPRYHADALYKVKASGNMELKNTSFKLKKNPLEFSAINGNFSLSDNSVIVNELKGKISSSDFEMNGVFRNFLTFLLIPGQDAEVNAKLVSNEINLDELLTNKSVASENDTTYKLKFNPRLVCRLNVEVGNLHFRKFSATHIKGEINLADQVISGKGLSFSSMNGTTVMDAAINASRNDSIIISCDAKCSRLDITQLFIQMENFGQTTMTDKNVKGKISADVQFKSSWTTGLHINSKSVLCTSDLTIDNGELNEFRPILALSKYLKLSDLKHIRFSTLKNQVRISNRKIFIPAMEINSSALNLTGSGVHDFDNMVDYKIQLLLSDILGKRVKDQNTEFGQIEDDGLGRTKLFLTMKGPVDDPKIGYDKKGVVEKIKNEIKTERQNLKNLLKQEFGSHKNDSTSVQKKKKEEMQIDWDTKDDK